MENEKKKLFDNISPGELKIRLDITPEELKEAYYNQVAKNITHRYL